MTDAPLIRPFATTDGPGCWAVFVAAVRIGAAGHYTPEELADWLPDDAYPDGYADWLAGEITFVAEQKVIVGFAMMNRDGYLDLLFVLPDYRSSGLANRLYAELTAQARALGLRRMTVKASRLAERFFARLGWRPSHGEDGSDLKDSMSRHMEVDL